VKRIAYNETKPVSVCFATRVRRARVRYDGDPDLSCQADLTCWPVHAVEAGTYAAVEVSIADDWSVVLGLDWLRSTTHT
jgi:hypothetical protein